MKQKLGIFTALILSLAIAGSTFAANIQANTQNNMTATKTTKTKKATMAKKHRKSHKAKKSSRTKKAAAATTSSTK